jgi:hypothetical protein
MTTTVAVAMAMAMALTMRAWAGQALCCFSMTIL